MRRIMVKPKILVIDDDREIGNFLGDYLKGSGYEHTIVESAEVGLAKLLSDQFDIAFLDIVLPGMSGIELLEVLYPNEGRAKIVMTSAVDTAEAAVQAMKLGAVDYIVKPFTLSRLQSVIDSLTKSDSPSGEAGIE